MKKTLPLARKQNRKTVIIFILALLILSAISFSSWQVYRTILDYNGVNLSNRVQLLKLILESKHHRDPIDFAKEVLKAYQASINQVPEGVVESAMVGTKDDRIVVLLRGRGDPNAERHPRLFYLLDKQGQPLYLPQGHIMHSVMQRALQGKSGVMEVSTVERGSFQVAYAPLTLNNIHLGLAIGTPLEPLKKAMLEQFVFILLMGVFIIAGGAWLFLRLNPLLAELTRSQEVNIQMLGEASHYKDTDTGWHVERMAEYSVAIGKAMNLPAKQIMMLGLAARMHDLGKVGTPDDVLKKPGKLDDDEWVIMRRHSQVGAQIMADGDTPLFEMAKAIAQGHHEKWDGSGYPDGVVGKDIPLVARITAVADVFDALTMKRPYKDPWPLEKALAVIQQDAGSHFDPEVVQAFLSVQEEILAIKERWEKKEQEASRKA